METYEAIDDLRSTLRRRRASKTFLRVVAFGVIAGMAVALLSVL